MDSPLIFKYFFFSFSDANDAPIMWEEQEASLKGLELGYDSSWCSTPTVESMVAKMRGTLACWETQSFM